MENEWWKNVQSNNESYDWRSPEVTDYWNKIRSNLAITKAIPYNKATIQLRQLFQKSMKIFENRHNEIELEIQRLQAKIEQLEKESLDIENQKSTLTDSYMNLLQSYKIKFKIDKSNFYAKG